MAVDAGCAGKAQVAHLDGRNALHEDGRPALVGIAHEVDGDVDLHLAQGARRWRRWGSRAGRGSVSKAATTRWRSGLPSSSPSETPTISKRSRSCASIRPVISAADGMPAEVRAHVGDADAAALSHAAAWPAAGASCARRRAGPPGRRNAGAGRASSHMRKLEMSCRARCGLARSAAANRASRGSCASQSQSVCRLDGQQKLADRRVRVQGEETLAGRQVAS